MKKVIVFTVIFLLLAIPALGQDSKEIWEEMAMLDPHEGISVPHESELARAGVETITVFRVIMDPGLFGDTIAGGGVFKVGAMLTNGSLLKGYAYLDNLTYWSDFQLTVVYYSTKEELKGAKHLLFDRDTGRAFNFTGNEIFEVEEKDKQKIQVITYDPGKMKNDLKFRNEFFNKYGTVTEDLDQFYYEYLEEKGVTPDKTISAITELNHGTPEWEKHFERLAKLMPYVIQMDDKSLVRSYINIGIYKQIATEIPGFTMWDRFLKRSTVSASQVALVFTPLWYLSVIGVGSDVVMAAVDTDWHGFYGRAVTKRSQMAPYFRHMSIIHKAVLANRDAIIHAQAKRIKELEEGRKKE